MQKSQMSNHETITNSLEMTHFDLNYIYFFLPYVSGDGKITNLNLLTRLLTRKIFDTPRYQIYHMEFKCETLSLSRTLDANKYMP